MPLNTKKTYDNKYLQTKTLLTQKTDFDNCCFIDKNVDIENYRLKGLDVDP